MFIISDKVDLKEIERLFYDMFDDAFALEEFNTWYKFFIRLPMDPDMVMDAISYAFKLGIDMIEDEPFFEDREQEREFADEMVEVASGCYNKKLLAELEGAMRHAKYGGI